jgi:hypothetical protein
MDLVDPALHYVPRPGWRARIDARADLARVRSRRGALLLLVALAHVALLHRLHDDRVSLPPRPDDPTPLMVLTLNPDLPPPPPSPRKRVQRSDVPLPVAMTRVRTLRSAPPDPPAVAPVPATRPRLFGVDGAVLLPDGVQDDLSAVTDPRARFDFKVPGLIEARTQPPRRAALTYEATRFDESWIEQEDLLTESLKKAIEKTTVTIRIPLPRAPGSKAVCKIAILMAAGGCGITNESDGYVVRLDDPDTLDINEDVQCQAWWDAMANASNETAWNAARVNYEAHCHKPLAASGGASR